MEQIIYFGVNVEYFYCCPISQNTENKTRKVRYNAKTQVLGEGAIQGTYWALNLSYNAGYFCTSSIKFALLNLLHSMIITLKFKFIENFIVSRQIKTNVASKQISFAALYNNYTGTVEWFPIQKKNVIVVQLILYNCCRNIFFSEPTTTV